MARQTRFRQDHLWFQNHIIGVSAQVPGRLALIWGLIWLGSAGPAGAEALPLARTDPGHLGPRQLAPLLPPADLRQPRHGPDPLRLYQFPDGLKGLAKQDATFSRLCRRGAFNQKLDGRQYASAPGQRYGVASSGSPGFNDPQQRAQPGKVYLFERADSSDCRVLVADQRQLEPFRVKLDGAAAPP